MTRYLIVFICGVAILLGFSRFSFAEERKLIIRGSDNYAPFTFTNESGEVDGFNVDIIRALMQDLGYDYELKLENWDEVVQQIENKEIDVVIGMIYSPERATKVRFSLPLCVVNRNIITRKGDNYTSLDDLKGKKVIVEKGGWFHKYLLKNDFDGDIIESEDIYESLELLSTGHYDAVLASEMVVQYAMKRLVMTDLTVKKLSGVETQNYSMAVNQDNDDLLYKLNIGLQHLKLSGAYDQIYNKWFGIYTAKKYYPYILIALTVFVAIALLLILFVWLLRRQVARATRLLDYSRQEVGIAIDAGGISAWTYFIQERMIKSLHGDSLGGTGSSIDVVYDMVHPDDRELFRNAINDLASNRKQKMEVSFRIREEGKTEYSYINTKMVRVESSKEYPSHVVGTYKNITKDIQIRRKLEDYRAKSEFVIKSNEIILIQYDIATQMFSRVGDSDLQDGTSYTLDQYFALVYPEDLPIALVFVSKLNQAKEYKIDGEYRILSEGGTYNWFNISAVAYKYDDRGKITSYMGMRRDNTKWKTINDDLILLREKAEESNRLKSAFLANMSHEIRTPLNAIVGFSELIIGMEDKEEQAEYMEIVKTNNELLLQLVNDILDLSRIEAGFINFSYDEFDFPEYIKELGESLKIKANSNVEFVNLNRYDDLKVCSDRNRISQVITNFVTNAFKFTTHGSVTLSYIYQNDGVKVSVTDTGIGIAPENRESVFKRFMKVNDFAQGTGLGLSICKVIIEALQGTIGVDSELGVGSTFWFWIPRNITVDEWQTESDGVSEGVVKTSVAPIFPGNNELLLSKNKKTILVAEDVTNNYVIICSILRDRFNVIRAVNGMEAVEKAKRYNPDIILMDMKMPQMGGLEATREIRKFNPGVQIIALTAYVFDTNRQEAIGAGCDEFLTKPINRSVLLQMIDKV